MLLDVLKRIWRAAPYLDLWPVTRKMLWSGGAKSYHFGGSFPHAKRPDDANTMTDRLGRLARWDRIHLIDGSVFPNVPATTFTLNSDGQFPSHRLRSDGADGFSLQCELASQAPTDMSGPSWVLRSPAKGMRSLRLPVRTVRPHNLPAGMLALQNGAHTRSNIAPSAAAFRRS